MIRRGLFRKSINNPPWAYIAVILIGFGIMLSSTLFHGLIGSSGRQQMLTAGALTLCIGTIVLLKKANSIYATRRVVASISVFLFYVALSFLRGHDIFHFKNLVFISTILVCFLAGWTSGFVAKNSQGALSRALTLLLLLIGSGSFAWYVFIDPRAIELTARISGDEELHPVGVAYVLGGCTVMLLSIGLQKKGKLSTIITIISLPLLLMGFLAAASRGATVALAASTIFIFFAITANKASQAEHGTSSRGNAIKGLALLLILAGYLVLTSNTNLTLQFDFLIARFERALDPFGDASISARQYIWQQYWQSVDEFWLLGLPNYSAAPYPHNLFYEIWIRFGIFGLPLIFIVTSAFVKVINHARKGQLGSIDIVFAGLFIYGFTNGQFNLTLEANRALWLGLGFLTSRKFQYYKAKTPPKKFRLPSASTPPATISPAATYRTT